MIFKAWVNTQPPALNLMKFSLSHPPIGQSAKISATGTENPGR